MMRPAHIRLAQRGLALAAALAVTGLAGAVRPSSALAQNAASQPAASQPAAGQAAASQTGPSAKKKIVFLAGPKDHGRPGNGRHEYEKDLRDLAAYLESSPNLKGMIETKVYVGKAPTNLAEIQDASVIVIESSSDRDAKEMHPLFPQDPTTDHLKYDAETTAYLQQFDSLVKKGVGIVVFHYSTWVENAAARKYYLQWIGALWVNMGSTNPVADWTITPANPEHPILNGVKPWTYRDEIFCKYFLPRDPRRTDLVIATPAGSKLGPQVAGFAYNREDGGRGFAYGGVDFHDNLATVDDYRRFLLNGIVWAAGLEVPAGGVQSVPLAATAAVPVR
jgi:type 1 glutamine amidotransferase